MTNCGVPNKWAKYRESNFCDPWEYIQWTLSGQCQGPGHSRFKIRITDPRDRALKNQAAGSKPKQSARNWGKSWRDLWLGSWALSSVVFREMETRSQGDWGGQWETVVSDRLQDQGWAQWTFTKPVQIEGWIFIHWFSQSRLGVFSSGKLCKEEIKARRVRCGSL